MKQKPETSYGTIIRYPKGSGILSGFVVIVLALLMMVVVSRAQDPIPPIPDVYPPVGHDFNCGEVAYYVGPNCANPVLWDLPGMLKLGTWAFFNQGAGEEAGLVVGFVWNWRTQEYDYLLLTRQHYADIGYAGQYKIIPTNRINYPIPVSE